MKKIKITIISEGKNIKWIPGIPIGLIKFILLTFWNCGVKYALKTNIKDKKVSKMLDKVKSRDISKLFDILKESGPLDLLEVEDGKSKSYVYIRIV
ncbi:MAG: hypothetical protein ACQERZ_02680 [Fusobacteriota bacterium]